METPDTDQLKRALMECSDVVLKMGWSQHGLCDCIDNHGAPYQSQWLADLLDEVRPTEPTTHAEE